MTTSKTPPLAAAEAPAAAEAAAAADLTEGRVLMDIGDFKMNDVARLTPAHAAAAVADGWFDTHPDAVAYAASLDANAAE